MRRQLHGQQHRHGQLGDAVRVRDAVRSHLDAHSVVRQAAAGLADYLLETDLHGDVKARATQRIALKPVSTDLGTVPGKVTAVKLDVSYDDGATWQKVTLAKGADGYWKGSFRTATAGSCATSPGTGTAGTPHTAPRPPRHGSGRDRLDQYVFVGGSRLTHPLRTEQPLQDRVPAREAVVGFVASQLGEDIAAEPQPSGAGKVLVHACSPHCDGHPVGIL